MTHPTASNSTSPCRNDVWGEGSGAFGTGRAPAFAAALLLASLLLAFISVAAADPAAPVASGILLEEVTTSERTAVRLAPLRARPAPAGSVGEGAAPAVQPTRGPVAVPAASPDISAASPAALPDSPVTHSVTGAGGGSGLGPDVGPDTGSDAGSDAASAAVPFHQVPAVVPSIAPSLTPGMTPAIQSGMPGAAQAAYPADVRAMSVAVPPAAEAVSHGPNGAISGADAGDATVGAAGTRSVSRPVAFLPPAGHPPSENLLDRMDVYALSPDAAKLALPRMVPLVMVERVRAGRLPMPAWDGIIARASRLSGLEERLIAAVVRAESGFNVGAVSPKGARGPMQIMPATGQELGLEDPFDPQANVEAGSRYLRQQLDRFGSLELALAAYNAGPGNVERFGGVPPFAETRAFVSRVLSGLD